jgi:acylphosphatase
MTDKKRVKIRISGRVQGVGFRFFTQRSACTLGIKGFVENMEDGSVLIEAQGTTGQLEQFISFVSRGPQWAQVKSTETEDVPLKDDEQFTVF